MLTLQELQKLRDAKLPESLKLTNQETITNPKLFIETHLRYLESNSGNLAYMPYYERLVKLHQCLKL